MSELGYKRSAKKCKEKFENVHKYYKRTKEGRAGRQDGKTYKFFTELEALQTAIPSSSALPLPHQPALAPPPVAVSLQPPPVSLGAQFSNLNMPVAPPSMTIPGMQPPTVSHVFPVTSAAAPPASSPLGLIFSSNSSSLSPGSGDEDDDEEDVEGEPSTAGSSRKRKRAAEMLSSVSEGRRMMEYFEGLMKRVMQKQEEMQKRFLEAIEKREQDRLAREEAWRRQEMYRLAREHELMAQERAISASRDAAIMSFLQKITGQTIQLPTTVPVVSPRAPPPPQAPAAAAPPTSRTQPQQQPPLPPQPPQTYQPTPPVSQEIIAAIPEQQIPPPPQEIIGTSGGGEVPSPSRWPKTEVLALIRLRSGMETKYQEAGPKGPLWEEISAGMHRLGYKRNPKRCKEKWENINKYFKKVKESNKKRPEDAKTCPYFHELDALYRRKVLIGQTSGGGIEIRSDAPTNVAAAADAEQPKNGGPEEEETESAEKPEDTVKEMMNHSSEQQQSRGVDLGDKADEVDDENLDQDENEEELDEDEDEETEEERKMAYKIEYQQQRQNAGTPNGSGNGSVPPFVTMVQ